MSEEETTTTEQPEPAEQYGCPGCGCRHLVKRSPHGKWGYKRYLPKNKGVRRIRYCRNCGRRVSTIERVEA